MNPATGADLMLLALEPASSSPPAGSQPGQATTRDVRPLLQTRFDERNGTISPDGRWLAYESNSSGRFEIYVRPFPNVDDGQWQVSSAGGTEPQWAPGGDELFYMTPGRILMAVAVETGGAGWSAGLPVQLFGGVLLPSWGTQARSYDIAPDAQRFLVLRIDTSGAIVVVQNWFEELKRLVPTR